VRGEVNKLSHYLNLPGLPGRTESRFRWKGIRSCNFATWYGDLEAVNGFDEIFQGWGHEDADLVLRLHQNGLVRKNGFWTTEVFHLWHRENSRNQSENNRQRVLQRMQQPLIRAVSGLAEAAEAKDVTVSELNG